jgi:hypothetical protein
MSDYSLSAWDLAEKLYDKSDTVGVPLHHRDASTRSAWLQAAQRKIAAGKAPMETPNTGI